MEPTENKRNRWYDQYLHIGELIHIARVLPASQQENLGKNLMAEVEKYRSFLREPKSLGYEVVLRMYKASAKLRWYDSVHLLQKALNTMMTLPGPIITQINQECETLVLRYRPLMKTGVAKPTDDKANTLKTVIDFQNAEGRIRPTKH